MRLLLDSHVMLSWLGMDAHKLSPRLRDVIGHAESVTFSVATVWELEIKRALGRLVMPFDDWARVWDTGFELLTIGLEDALVAAKLPLIHRDPFDRMMVAQALRRDLTLVTADEVLPRYGVAVLTA